MAKNYYDIVFVVPSASPLLQEESMGTLILSKKLVLSGFSVKIIRFWQIEGFKKSYDLFKNNLVSSITSLKTPIVSFYCRCTDYHVCLDIAKELKTKNNELLISFGGPQSELVAKETLSLFKYIDFICCSEGENTIIPFIKFILSGHNYIDAAKIPGLTFRDSSGSIHQNTMPTFLDDNYKRGFYYYDLIPKEVISNSKRTSIDVGRGCPFACTFCSTKTFWKQKYRLRDISELIDEIEMVIHKFGITTFDLDHDLFTVSKKRITIFCNELLRRGIKIKWFCSSRIDTIDREMIDLMSQTGMVKILFGIETGSVRMQKVINKNLDLNRCNEIVKYCVNKGIKVLASFIYGMPEETEEDFELTFKLMQEMEIHGANTIVWLCGVLNGTAMYNKYKSLLYLSDNNVKNSSFFGFNETNEDIIKNNLVVFPHFCDFNNDLRKKLHYFELFHNIWSNIAPETFHNISKSFIAKNKRNFDAYTIFCQINNEYLSKGHYNENDKFWGIASTVCIEMIYRFIRSLDNLGDGCFNYDDLVVFQNLAMDEIKTFKETSK